MPLRRKKEEDPETTLARCIVLLDDIRAYRRKDPELIEAQFEPLKKSRFRDIYDMWVKARPAAEKIVDMPLRIPGAKETIRRLAWLKVANRVFLIALIFFIAIQIVPIWRRTLGSEFLSGNGLILAGVFIVLVVASMNLATVWDYRLRKKIVAYEEATMDEYAPARDKMKECVSKMMRSLAREIGRTKKSPDYYGLVLYFDDYDNIEVKDKWRPKTMFFFKKSYNHFQVVPKP
jgi:Fic family protein